MAGPDPTPLPLDHLTDRGKPEANALIADGHTLTYAELEDIVARTAASLLARGLVPGDRVASWMGKTTLACILPLAAARAGLVHVPINPVLRRAQAEHILADSGARLLIANQARLESLGSVDAECIALEQWHAGDDRLGPSSHPPDTLTALLYTSGSTGRPKGVTLSHANLWLGAISVAYYLGLTPVDRTLAVLPLAFDYGENQLLAAWAAGGTAIAFDYLLPRDVVRAVGRHDVTVLAGVPPLWHQLAEADWSARSWPPATPPPVARGSSSAAGRRPPARRARRRPAARRRPPAPARCGPRAPAPRPPRSARTRRRR
jgi:acyl-CoA synthetase (AMP-forming)/AMP-acid ligase II